MPSATRTKRLASPSYRKPDTDDEAAFNRAATEIGIVLIRKHEKSTYLNRIMCLKCGEIWPTPKDFRVTWVGWYKHAQLGTSPPRSEREFKFDPDVKAPFRCPKGCNTPPGGTP